VLACYHLDALSIDETRAYVEHRMRAVGWEGNPGWEEPAFALVHQHSAGIPRRINRLCSRVLLSGALEQAALLTAAMVDATAIELEEDLSSGLGIPAAAVRLDDTTDQLAELDERIGALERLSSRRERVFSRMAELFSDQPGRRS